MRILVIIIKITYKFFVGVAITDITQNEKIGLDMNTQRKLEKKYLNQTKGILIDYEKLLGINERSEMTSKQ